MKAHGWNNGAASIAATLQTRMKKHGKRVFLWCFFLMAYFLSTIGEVGVDSIIYGLIAFLAIQGFWLLFCKWCLITIEGRTKDKIALASFGFALLALAFASCFGVHELAFALLTGFALGAISFLGVFSPVGY